MTEDTDLDQEIDNILEETTEDAPVSEPSGSVIEASVTVKPPKTPIAGKKPRKPGDERIDVIIDEGGEEEPSEVFIALNGKAYQVMRGVKVSLPLAVLNVLDNAKISRLIRTGNGEYVLRDTPRYTYRRV